MPSTATTRNRFNKQGTGDNSGTWGGILNTQGLDLLDESLDGVESIAVAADVVLTSTNYASDQARNRVLKFTGVGGFTVTIPGVEKYYLVHNTCTGTVTVKTAAGTGVAVSAGSLIVLYCDGTDCFGGVPTTNQPWALVYDTPVSGAAVAAVDIPLLGYSNIKITGTIIPNSAVADFYAILRTSADGVTYASGASDYVYSFIYQSGTSVVGAANAYAASIFVGTTIDTATALPGLFTADMFAGSASIAATLKAEAVSYIETDQSIYLIYNRRAAVAKQTHIRILTNTGGAGFGIGTRFIVEGR